MSRRFQDVRLRSEERDRRSGRSAPAPGLAALLVVGLVAAAALGLRAVAAGSAPEKPTPAADTAPAQAPEPVRITTRDTLRAGESLGQLLRRHGLSGPAFASALEAVREVQRPRTLQPGMILEVTARVPERVSGVSLRLDRDRSLHLVSDRGAGWRARIDSVPVTVDTVRVAGVVNGSLLNASLYGQTSRLISYEGYDERIELLLQLANNLFAWQIDFYRDLRPGDAFRVVIEREIRPDGTVRRARILAADFRNRDRLLSAVRFEAPGSPVRYYDEEGEATKKAFLKMPLQFGRRTSGFSRRRYHPVLKRYRAHRGIDYGAPRGTAVHATGAGTVTRAGRWGGYGRVVEVRHSGKYRTRYAHLSGIARGIQPGVRIEQDEVIGYVGSTGLSTAPHLHYEFLVYGRRRDPAHVELPPGDPVPAEHRDAYRRVKEERLRLLRELDLPPRTDRPGGAGGTSSVE